MPTQAVCRSCGHPVSSGARFCQNCGTDVSSEQGELATMALGVIGRKSAQEAALEELRQETLGEYEILGELGRGGMATVYLAHDIALDRRVAIKVMSSSQMDEGLAERFRREARTAASLNHPHIIPIYAVRERNALLYFVMKFVAGETLDPILKTRGALPIPMAQVILAQAASALGYAHRRGVIHRDVKPANIMLDEDGWVVMTDFGIAKVPSADGLTLTGVTVGTPAYMSPEQCMGKEVSGASDQYSLGVVAYEMLTGQKLFSASTAMAMMYAHFHETPRPLREIRPEIPPALEATVLRMLAKDASDRWPRIDDAFTAPALTHDDPTRQELMALAAGGQSAQRASRISTPTSPIPPAKRPLGSTTAAPTVASPAGATVVPPGATREAPSVTQPMYPGAGSTTPAASARPTASRTRSFPPVAPKKKPSWLWLLVGVAALAVAAIGLWLRPGAKPPVTQHSADSVHAPTTSASTQRPESAKVVVPAKPTAATPPVVARIVIRQARIRLDVGKTQPIDASLLTSGGQAIHDGRPMSWRSAAPAIATVTPDGLVQGVAPGDTKVTLAVDGVEASVPVSVKAAPPTQQAPVAIAALRVQPETATVRIGQESVLSAKTLDARGNELSGRTVNWRSSDSSVVTVSQAGRLVGRGPGTARVVAQSEGQSGIAMITVPALPVASLRLTPPSATLKPGESVTLGLSVLAGDGTQLNDRKVAWTSSDSTVATVASGRVSGKGPGSAKVTATVEGKTASMSVTVTNPAADEARAHAKAAEEISHQLDAFVAALNAQDVDRLKGVYPGMSAADERNWRTLLDNPQLKRVGATHDQLPEPEVTGNRATVPFVLHLKPEYSGMQVSPPPPVKYRAEFGDSGGSWQLIRLDPVK